MPKTPRREVGDNDLPPTPPSSYFKRLYYDEKGEPTDAWFDHIPESPLKHKTAHKVNFKAESPKKANGVNKKRPASPERRKTTGFDYRAFPRPSKAAERVRQSQRNRRQDIKPRPMPHSLPSSPCVPGKGFIPPKRISPRYYVVTGSKTDEITGKTMYQVREGGKLFWLSPDKVMKQSYKEFKRTDGQ